MASSPDRVTYGIAELAALLGVSVKRIKRRVADATLQLTQALGVCRARVQRHVA
jgi:DNA-directed RNA polymerase specialized sigma24 family protein